MPGRQAGDTFSVSPASAFCGTRRGRAGSRGGRLGARPTSPVPAFRGGAVFSLSSPSQSVLPLCQVPSQAGLVVVEPLLVQNGWEGSED